MNNVGAHVQWLSKTQVYSTRKGRNLMFLAQLYCWAIGLNFPWLKETLSTEGISRVPQTKDYI
jgi:hypothetical protein